jgi:hypothetical protein
MHPQFIGTLRIGFLGLVFAATLVCVGCYGSIDQLMKQSEGGVYIRAPSLVAAQNFLLVNSAGKPLAELSAAQGGGAGLVLIDDAGKARAALVITKGGAPGLKLYDSNGKVRASVVVSADNRPGIALYDSNEVARAALVESPKGESSLVLLDASGKQTATVPATVGHSRGSH